MNPWYYPMIISADSLHFRVSMLMSVSFPAPDPQPDIASAKLRHTYRQKPALTRASYPEPKRCPSLFRLRNVAQNVPSLISCVSFPHWQLAPLPSPTRSYPLLPSYYPPSERISGRVQVWDIQLNEFHGTGVALCLRSVLFDWSIMQPHLSTHPSCMIQLTTFQESLPFNN